MRFSTKGLGDVQICWRFGDGMYLQCVLTSVGLKPHDKYSVLIAFSLINMLII